MYKTHFAVAVGTALALLSATAHAALPVTGAHVPELASFDNIVQSWATAYNVKAVTVAIVRDKRLVYEKGFGYQDAGLTREILPDARMRLATNSVNVTKRALRQLVADGALDPESTVVDVLGPNIGAPISGVWGDSRMPTIKIKHLLDDTTCLSDGGQQPDGSAIYANTYVGANYWYKGGLGRNATAAERIKWHWGKSTTMRPTCTVGSTSSWSHYAFEIGAQIIAQKAYVALGRCDPNIIDYDSDGYAECTGLWYGHYVAQYVGDPIGATFLQAENLPADAAPEEIWYDSAGQYGTYPGPTSPGGTYPYLGAEWDREWTGVCSPYADCQQVPVAYSTDYYARPGSGTIVSSARDYARLLNIYWPGGMTPRAQRLDNGHCGGCFSVGYGSLPGTHTMFVDMVPVNATGKHVVTVVVLANKQLDDGGALANSVQDWVNNQTSWPPLPPPASMPQSWPPTDLYDDIRIKNYWNNRYAELDSSAVRVVYAPFSASSAAQRWRLRRDSGGYVRIVNAEDTSGMVSNEHNYAWAEYLEPHNSWWSEQWTLQDTGTAGTKRFNARWWNTHRLNVQNQYGYVEQSAVPDNYWSAWWTLQVVPSGATTCSASTDSPTCLCTSQTPTTPCPCGATACPPYWDTSTCSRSHYNAKDGCDCGCGGWDPDCDIPGQFLYCFGGSGTTCNGNTLQCE